MITIPTLTTERLILRAPRRDDFDAYAPALMSGRAIYIDGPYDRVGAWRDFCTDVSSWVLYGFGPWSIETRDGASFCGMVVLHYPDYFPEREIGWVLVQEAEGKGYAFEAAQAARAHAYDTLGWTTLVSYIDPPNARSIALAERLGARLDRGAPAPSPGDLVYRHPGPEALQ